MDKTRPKRRKETRSITLSPYLLGKIDTLVENEDFSSMSDFITISTSDFLVRYELENNEVSAMDILVKILQTPEGKRAFDKITSDTHAVSQAEQKTHDAPKNMDEFLYKICPEPRELTPKEKELAEKAKQRFKQPSDDNEKPEERTTSDKKTKKIILFENDVPREYILE